MPAEERDGKKERVLHTRVPAVLERELKRFADSLRIPVSNLVRAILEDALRMADSAGTGIEDRLTSAAKVLSHERERLTQRVERDPLVGVVAFQRISLALRAACVKCKGPIARDTDAYLALTDPPHSRAHLFVCHACLPQGG